MSMSTYVRGFRDMDGKFKEMLEIKRFCDSKKVSYPKEVTEYFGRNLAEDEQYMIGEMLEISIPHKEFDDERVNGSGIEILVKDIPKEVKVIRFTNSW